MRIGNGNTMETLAELGDAVLVNGTSVEGDDKEAETDEESVRPEEDSENVEALETATGTADNQYFVRSRLERETMYSQMLATYQEMYNSPNASSEQKTQAMSRISEINRLRNAIMIAENLVKARGINEIVIFSNNDSTSVVVSVGEELRPEQMAQIQNIVSRELNIGIETMNISVK